MNDDDDDDDTMLLSVDEDMTQRRSADAADAKLEMRDTWS